MIIVLQSATGKKRKGSDGISADNCDKPSEASDEDCHLMVESMESWFLADSAVLSEYYGQGFNKNSLPKNPDIEKIKKTTVIASLSEATQNTRKGRYSMGNHSFEILGNIDPRCAIDKSPWAKRFIVLLSEKMLNAR